MNFVKHKIVYEVIVRCVRDKSAVEQMGSAAIDLNPTKMNSSYLHKPLSECKYVKLDSFVKSASRQVPDFGEAMKQKLVMPSLSRAKPFYLLPLDFLHANPLLPTQVLVFHGHRLTDANKVNVELEMNDDPRMMAELVQLFDNKASGWKRLHYNQLLLKPTDRSNNLYFLDFKLKLIDGHKPRRFLAVSKVNVPQTATEPTVAPSLDQALASDVPLPSSVAVMPVQAPATLANKDRELQWTLDDSPETLSDVIFVVSTFFLDEYVMQLPETAKHKTRFEKFVKWKELIDRHVKYETEYINQRLVDVSTRDRERQKTKDYMSILIQTLSYMKKVMQEHASLKTHEHARDWKAVSSVIGHCEKSLARRLVRYMKQVKKTTSTDVEVMAFKDLVCSLSPLYDDAPKTNKTTGTRSSKRRVALKPQQ